MIFGVLAPQLGKRQPQDATVHAGKTFYIPIPRITCQQLVVFRQLLVGRLRQVEGECSIFPGNSGILQDIFSRVPITAARSGK